MKKIYAVKRTIIMAVEAESEEQATELLYSILDNGEVFDMEYYGGELEFPDTEEDCVVCLGEE